MICIYFGMLSFKHIFKLRITVLTVLFGHYNCNPRICFGKCLVVLYSLLCWLHVFIVVTHIFKYLREVTWEVKLRP